ncbi:flagellar protein FlaG [Planococcus salinus]|uniref:Flagellar protein FlaG n=1 Tax=Planococcus salinus TaxID=1848460 RepID=A0A3M8P6E1_9BACL|nr:flagellar protein FlaG [Planococcus salinus]RNF38774.1 flagellar protein FlaG [Planococcus salinus]
MEVKQTPVIHFSKTSEVQAVEPVKMPIAAEARKTEAAAQEQVTKEVLEHKVDGMNDFLEPTSTAVKFQLHEELNEYYIQVVDTKTDEVLKEIPNRKFLDMYASMTELMGMIVDEKL